MADFTIRPARPADVSAIAAIYGDAVLTGTATFEIEPPAETEMLRRLSILVDGGYPYLVAETGGAVIGYGYCGPYHLRPAYRDTVEDSIYLASEARRQGLGRSVLSALIDECEDRGFRQMIAIISDSGNARSLHLHRSAGFALVGTLKHVGYKHGRWLDTTIMQRALGPGGMVPPSR